MRRREVRGDVTNTVSAIRIIESAVAVGPIFVPRTGTIWNRIVRCRLLADPKNGGHNFLLQRVTFRMPRWVFSRRHECGRGLQHRNVFLRCAVGFLAHLFFSRQNFRWSGLSEKRRDRGNDHRESVSEGSGLHYFFAERLRAGSFPLIKIDLCAGNARRLRQEG